MFHVTVLSNDLRLFEDSKIYIFLFWHGSTRNWKITYIFYFVLKFWGFLKIFFLFIAIMIYNRVYSITMEKN